MYTHKIIWKEWLDWAESYVEKSFLTTPDMVQNHLETLHNKAKSLNKVYDNIIGIRVIELQRG